MRNKRLLLVFLAVVLILPSFLVNAAPSGSTTDDSDQEAVLGYGIVAAKDEVVYATLRATGEMEEIYVVNILDVTHPGTIIDKGTYTSLKNLTDLSEIEQVESGVRVNASAGKFYYQGNTNDKELPWNIHISYLLDGNSISPKEMVGKDGHLQLNIVTSKNEAADSSFFENYLLQISIVLDSEVYRDIVAPDAMIANVGKNKQATFTVMPEQDGDLHLEANVVDFEMQGIEIAAVPYTMSIDAPDIDDMKGDMKSLTDAIKQLNDGVTELKDGVAELNKGVGELKDGSGQYQKGMEDISGASSDLIAGSSTINDSLTLISSSISETSGEMDFTELAQLPEGLSQIAGGLYDTADGLSFLRDNYSQAYKALDGAILAIPDYQISEQEIHTLYYVLTEAGTDTKTLDKLLESYEAGLTAKGTYLAVKEGFAAVDGALEEISGSVRLMGDTLSGISSELRNSLENLDMDAFVQLEAGLAELASKYGEFHTGLVSYTDGVSKLSDSYKELHSGIVSLSDGTQELDNGVGELQDGTKKLYESTSDLPEQMQEEIDNMIADYDKSDFEAVSFVSTENDHINSVQFVIKTESIKKEEEEIIVEEKEKVKGFWSRFLGLFSWGG